MTMATPEVSSDKALTPRPTDPTALLLHHDLKALWQARNIKANRFSVLNLDLVIGEIGLEHTTSKKYFDEAKEAIVAQGWKTIRNFEYECSHTQIFPVNRAEPRRFGHCATTIVALELAAKVLAPDYDVYLKLRILPATYFVDLFDREVLDRLRRADPAFDATCLLAIGQQFDKGLLDQHSWGMTLTKPIAEKLHDYLNKLEGVQVGPVRCVGDPEQHSAKLATKNRVTDMTFPTTFENVPPLAPQA